MDERDRDDREMKDNWEGMARWDNRDFRDERDRDDREMRDKRESMMHLRPRRCAREELVQTIWRDALPRVLSCATKKHATANGLASTKHAMTSYILFVFNHFKSHRKL